MNLREQIESLVARDNQMTPHHMSAHRVDPNELHPALQDNERASKSRSVYQAKALVEHFHSRLEGRSMRPVDTDDIVRSDGSPPNTNTPPLWQTPEGINIHKCAYDARGIVEVVCSKDDFRFDLPIYIVNPPLLVEDENGEIEVVVYEDENGDPITRRYTEDPERAMEELLVDLVEHEEQEVT